MVMFGNTDDSKTPKTADAPVSQADIKPTTAQPAPSQEQKIPMLNGIESDDQGKMMEEYMTKSSINQSKPLKQVKGPVFISLKKYKELRTDLDELKHTSAHLKAILERIKENRDSGFDLLEKSTDTLLKLEEQSEAVNNLLKN